MNIGDDLSRKSSTSASECEHFEESSDEDSINDEFDSEDKWNISLLNYE